MKDEMSDTPEDPYSPDKLPFFQVATEDLHRFLLALNVDGSCSVCGTRDWGHVQTDTSPLWSLTGFPDVSVVQPLVALRCKKCSNMRFHSFSGLREWLDENPSRENGDEH
jgi:hypothetical protein